MSYQSLFKTLESQIEVEVQGVITSARKKAEIILRTAQQKVDSINKQMAEEAAKKDEVKEEKKTTIRKQGLSKLFIRTKQELFQQLFNTVKERLMGLPRKAEYPRTLKKLIQEATADFPECTRIRVNARDTSLAKKILSELKLNLEVEPTEDFSAGLIALSADGRMSIINTLELRLERVIPLVSPQVAKILYG